MTKPVVFVINGPRRSGKDTAATAMADAAVKLNAGRWHVLPIITRCKLGTLERYGLDPALLDIYEHMKDEPLDVFMGMSFRQAVIAYSAEMKAKHGDAVWIETWQVEAKTLFDLGMAQAVVVPDCRFMIELMAAMTVTPAVLLYRVYRTEKMQHDGNAWADDIGSWLFPELFDVRQVALLNTGPIDDLRYVAWSTAIHYYRSIQRATASV